VCLSVFDIVAFLVVAAVLGERRRKATPLAPTAASIG
jgi:hypothetical protein